MRRVRLADDPEASPVAPNLISPQPLECLLKEIEPADPEWLKRAQSRQDKLTKPPGSLGWLEEIANRLCSMQRTLEPSVSDPEILVFAGDHGVCEEGINAFPQAVTRQMVMNFLAGGAAINALARSAGAKLKVIDVGTIGPRLNHPGLVSYSLGPGTRNFCREPAMTEAEALGGIAAGVECAKDAILSGSRLLAIGDMGIGNTTVASALCRAITNQETSAVCGRGTASDDSLLMRKRMAVERATALHLPHVKTPLDLLSRLGGFEIAAMCGVCLEAARTRVPIVIDGFISTAAAAIAVIMKPAVRDYLIAAHESAEPGHRLFLQFLRLEPLLKFDMRLGEATGAALAIPLVRAAASAFLSMATFETAGVAESFQKIAG